MKFLSICMLYMCTIFTIYNMKLPSLALVSDDSADSSHFHQFPTWSFYSSSLLQLISAVLANGK